MSAFRTLINNLFQKNFDITFMRNEKKTLKTLIVFFLIKNFFKQIVNQFLKGICQHFLNNNKMIFYTFFKKINVKIFIDIQKKAPTTTINLCYKSMNH